ncbi:hypothetical protein VNO77_38946 [Canavalia gladiata]|uniref:Uncharacterized protein n=1 Tax=Canavalia gladiata TaxID=3824 RepID=A0AAN9KBM1_CANGL
MKHWERTELAFLMQENGTCIELELVEVIADQVAVALSHAAILASSLRIVNGVAFGIRLISRGSVFGESSFTNGFVTPSRTHHAINTTSSSRSSFIPNANSFNSSTTFGLNSSASSPAATSVGSNSSFLA